MFHVRRRVQEALSRRPEAALALERPHQRHVFERLAPRFAEMHALVRGGTDSLTTAPWKRFNAEVEAAFLPHPPYDFLRHPTIEMTMFVDRRGAWLKWLVSRLEDALTPERLARMAREDDVGRPRLSHGRYRTSTNTLHHISHMVAYARETGRDVPSFSRIVEWGGGYGNFAKLAWRNRTAPMTYVSIDTPLFSTLQWLYLSSVLEPERVHLVTGPDDGVREGCVNLVPTTRLEGLDVEADLFVSTWALSESSHAAMQLVEERDWFGARNLLLAHHVDDSEFVAANRVAEKVVARGGKRVPVSGLPGSHYVVC